MPRISAPTLAEHRAIQIRTLHETVRNLLRDAPNTPPSLADIAARAGLARSSVYQYVHSRDELLMDLLQESAPRWRASCVEAMATAANPVEGALTYLDAALELLVGPERGLARTLIATWPDHTRAQAEAVREDLLAPLREALAGVPAPDPDAAAEFLTGLTVTAARRVDAGAPLEHSRAQVSAIAEPYLREAAGRA